MKKNHFIYNILKIYSWILVLLLRSTFSWRRISKPTTYYWKHIVQPPVILSQVYEHSSEPQWIILWLNRTKHPNTPSTWWELHPRIWNFFQCMATVLTIESLCCCRWATCWCTIPWWSVSLWAHCCSSSRRPVTSFMWANANPSKRGRFRCGMRTVLRLSMQKCFLYRDLCGAGIPRKKSGVYPNKHP